MQEKIRDLHVVIMAGGAGVRFWPASTQERPKQFLDILGTGSSLLQMTYQRALRLVGSTKVWVVTASSYADLVYEQLPEVPHGNVLLETRKCNTCPCLAFAAEMIATRYPEDVMLVVPSDHLIVDDARYDALIRQAYDFAKEHDALLTLGIEPTRPETGYGYIQAGDSAGYKSVCEVKSFVEKPDREVAKAYLAEGNYLWNSGIFLWRVSVFQGVLKAQQQAIYDLFEGIGEVDGGPAFTIRVQEIYE
ncbi:MAG: mannose-1-phosphate guanylyltransferase, partial [Bacteroidetes bacterium]